MSQPATAVLEIEKIDVEEGFNPRTRFDEDRLAELEATVKQDGVLTALTVAPAKAGRYTLIAGERRLIAAKRAGKKKVPVVIRTAKGARAAALVENLIREDLDPIDTARGLAELAEAENLTTHRQIAMRIGRTQNVAWVSERLRLLRLPKGVQEHIAAGEVPVAAEKVLREAAKVSPRVAECACQLAARGTVEGRDLVERFGEVLQLLTEASFTDKPTMIGLHTGAPLGELIADPEQRQALTERYIAACPYVDPENPAIRFGEAEVDAARAAGCLLEHRSEHQGWISTVAYITDADLAADLALRVVERVEREAAESAKNEDGAGANGSASEEAREARRKQRHEDKRRAEAAREHNQKVGRNLVRRRGAKSRRDHGLARAKALAAVLLADHGELAAAGLRLAFPQLQDIEVKRLKSGEQREKVSYADREQSTAYLAERIEKARSANEVLEFLADALIAAVLTDEEELPRSRRVNCDLLAAGAVEKHLGTEIKSVRPRKQRSATAG